jgi:hypothetical protein
MMKGASDNIWAPAQERFNKFARIDRELASRLGFLSAHQARDDRLAFAIEAGRVYGLRQQRYNMLLKGQLNRDAQHPHVETMW